jgi:hypothetical protein
MPEYTITGPWVAAENSANHFEVARTNNEGVLAVRNTFAPTAVLYCTPNQLIGFGTAITSGQMRSLGLHG